jgi:hypothetical protein
MIELNWESLKHYFWAGLGVTGIVLFWNGIWSGLGSLPYLEYPIVSLIVGLIILASSGLLLHEFDPTKEEEQKKHKIMHEVHRHKEKHLFKIKYQDKIGKKEKTMEAGTLKKIEKGFLVFVEKEGKEIFVPIHRVTQVMHKEESYWKKHGAK